MLRSMKELRGYKIRAKDGDIGKVVEFYFDDKGWTIRYLVADTGNWLPGRQVLIAPAAFHGQPDWKSETFPVILTKEMIKESPHISTDRPVSRQKELKLNRYYGWPIYWSLNPEGIPVGELPVAESGIPPTEEPEGDSHLRSSREVIGYHIQAKDGEIGHVDDFIVDDENWIIRYMIVDTRNWLPGKKVLVSPHWIEEVNWAEAKVHVDLTREKIKDSPEYDPAASVNREYEEILYDYYGRPKYWK